jgi:hypothetical protein
VVADGCDRGDGCRDLVGVVVRWWFVFLAGALFMLLPGMVNPLAVVNGSTIIGLGLLAWASLNIVKGDRK